MRIVYMVLALLALSQSSFAATCSRTLTFVDGSVLNASQLNGEFNAITNCANSLSDANIATSAAILPAKLSATIAGDGLARDGTTGVLSVGVDNSTIEISSDELRVKDGGITPAKLSSSVATSDGNGLQSVGISATVASNILTIALKQKDGSTDPSASVPSRISFRDSTATNGAYSTISVTSALSLDITNGSTLGTISGAASYLYVYAINNSGTVVLGVSGSNFFEDGSLQDTTAEGGAGTADDGQTIYAASTLVGKAIRLIGRVLITEATAGAWATSPTEVSINPFTNSKFWMVSASITGTNPDLGASAVASFTGITNSALTLTNNTSGPNILTSRITCSSTNTPTGTTCAAGNEEVGVSFTIPVAPVSVMACAQFAHFTSVSANGNIAASFQIVETPNNAQTITQSGLDISRDDILGNASTMQTTFPHRVCSMLHFDTSGQKSVRLFYKQGVSGSVSTSTFVLGAGAGQAGGGNTPMVWTVYPLNP